MATPDKVTHAVCIGGGLIGSGWAARLALCGVEVTVYDPSPAAADAVEASVAAARRTWGKLGALPAQEGAVHVLHDAADLPAALAKADWVQESLPEREELKQQALAQIEPHLPQEAVIASSTSGLLPSRLQSGMRHPERFCVAHPFTPVYLLPLVELCPGEQTATATLQRAAAFYRTLGMTPLTLKKEIDGFIADRLMEALWREALWLVNDDIASTDEVDDAIRLGCGVRWAFMGPFLTYRLGGGAGGMRHFMAQFAPALKLPWTKLMDTPELNDALLDKIVAQSDAQAAGASIGELMTWRDDCIVSLLQALSGAGTGLGLPGGAQRSGAPGPAAAARVGADGRLLPYQARVTAEWIDYNGHMNEARYLQVASEACDAVLAYLGVDAAYVASGRSFYTVETHLRHLAQGYLGDALQVSTEVLAMDGKCLHLFHSVKCGEREIATAEQLLLHIVDEKVQAAEGEMLAKAAALVKKAEGSIDRSQLRLTVKSSTSPKTEA